MRNDSRAANVNVTLHGNMIACSANLFRARYAAPAWESELLARKNRIVFVLIAGFNFSFADKLEFHV